jgi:hypothetical protein
MLQMSWSFGRLIARTHFMFALSILLIVTAVMGAQIAFRRDFADTELHADVMDRWGSPILQAAPSVRFVEHGAVFTRLEPLALSGQAVDVEATMNYRRRGLVYFSGFDFTFHGTFTAENDRPYPIDLVFVFPLQVNRAQVLLTDLQFAVDDVPERIALEAGDDKLVWTGRADPGQKLSFDISYGGRGLDSFTYVPDPALPVRGLDLRVHTTGGSQFDYPEGVVPATTFEQTDDACALEWTYDSLEAGVPMGVTLPLEHRFDEIIGTMIHRAWAPFLCFFVGLVVIGIRGGRRLRGHEVVLVVSAYCFFYVLLPYLTAFMSFYVAYVVSLATVGALVLAYLRALYGRGAVRPTLGMLVAFLTTPTLAVILAGYTGLLYTLEILTGLALLMFASTRPSFGAITRGVADLAEGVSS